MLRGYLVAVIVSAALAIVGSNVLWALVHPRLGPIIHLVPSVVLGATFLTAIFAFPGWLVTVLFAEYRKVTRLAWFAITGILNSIFALWLLSVSFNGRLPLVSFDGFIWFGACLGGFAGGLVYWWMAGRYAGERALVAAALPPTSENTNS